MLIPSCEQLPSTAQQFADDSIIEAVVDIDRDLPPKLDLQSLREPAGDALCGRPEHLGGEMELSKQGSA